MYRIVYDVHNNREYPYKVERRQINYQGVVEWKYIGQYDHLERAQAEVKFLKDNPIKILEVIE